MILLKLKRAPDRTAFVRVDQIACIESAEPGHEAGASVVVLVESGWQVWCNDTIEEIEEKLRFCNVPVIP